MSTINKTKFAIICFAGIVISIIAWFAVRQSGLKPQHAAIVSASIAAITALVGLILSQGFKADNDKNILSLFRRAFDRPAFKTSFANEASSEDFMEAVENTITAINTGVLMDRKTDQILGKAEGGKGDLNKCSGKMDEVVSVLYKIQKLYKKGQSANKFRQFEYNSAYFMPEIEPQFANKMDDLTSEALAKFNTVLKIFKMPLLPTTLERDEHRPRKF